MKRHYLTVCKRREDNGLLPVRSKVGQLFKMVEQRVPSLRLFVERPDLPAHLDVAADEIDGDLIALVENDRGNLRK